MYYFIIFCPPLQYLSAKNTKFLRKRREQTEKFFIASHLRATAGARGDALAGRSGGKIKYYKNFF